MAIRHVVEEVEEPLKDVAADCFVYESDEVVSEESDDNGADENETTTDRTHECDGSSSSASSSATSGLSAITSFCLWKRQRVLSFWVSYPIRKVHMERQMPSKGSLLQAL